VGRRSRDRNPIANKLGYDLERVLIIARERNSDAVAFTLRLCLQHL
jgi:hypothetical protein